MPPPVIRSVLLCLAAFALGLPSAFAQTTERVSVDSTGLQASGSSGGCSISADGWLVAFSSWAPNLVIGDSNGLSDVFLRDRRTGLTTRVSVDSGGAQGNGMSAEAVISANGRIIAFVSDSSNLVPGDTNAASDVFVRDLMTGQTTRVSVDSAGLQGDWHSLTPAISATGRFVAFESYASNLVPGDTNFEWDIFLHDRLTGQTTRVSLGAAGAQANNSSADPAVSGDGRLVAFYSEASNLVPGDTNATEDVFVHDVQSGLTTRVSVSSSGAQANGFSLTPALSADGRLVVYGSLASNLVAGDSNGVYDVFLHDRQSGQTMRMNLDSAGTQANASSHGATISPEGRFVGFHSYATNLVPGDTNNSIDVFLHDRMSALTWRVSSDSLGLEGNNDSEELAISEDGKFVAFQSGATNLVTGDTNNVGDAFVRGGPSLTQTGACPGAVTLTINNATANGAVAIVYGPAGTFVKPTPPCQGITLGVSPPNLGAMRRADAAGMATLNFNAPPSACGRSVQAVDVTTCVATNVIVL